jgi:hypothetical protein
MDCLHVRRRPRILNLTYFYVTAGTFVSGAPLLGITAFLFWMRFRRRQTPRTKSLTVTSNTALALLSIVAVLYLLGVATWYE